MTTAFRNASLTRITSELLSNDVSTNTTPTLNGIDNVTEAIQAPEGCLMIPHSAFVPRNNPEDLVSYETLRHVWKITTVYFLELCVLFSVPCNVINMIVFWKHGIKVRINLCLFCLSFVDLVFLVSVLLLNAELIYSLITKTTYGLVFVNDLFKNMVHVLPTACVYASGFLSTLVAFERCLCVFSPLKAKSVIQTKTTAAIIVIGHVIILIGSMVVVSRYAVVCVLDPVTGKWINSLYPSEFYINNKGLVDFFSAIIFGVFLPGCYTAGISISTVVTVAKLRRMSEWREQSSSSASLSRGASAVRDLTLTRMLIGTSCVFLLCITPSFLFYVILLFVPDLSLNGKYHNTFLLLILVQQIILCINASANFFVYYSFGTKFRLSVRDMLCRWRGTTKRAEMRTGREVSAATVASSITE